jgi:membrane protein
MIKQIRSFSVVFYAALKRLFAEKYMYRAAALSYTTLLTMVPLLTMLVSLFAVLPFFSHLIDIAETYVVSNLLPMADADIESQVNNFISHATQLPIWSFVFLLVTASLLILTVEGAINQIWGVVNRPKKILFVLLYWLVLIILPVFIGASVLLSTALFSLSWFSETTLLSNVTAQILLVLPVLINALIFSLLYIIVPRSKVSLVDGLLGGLIAAILFELARRGFGFYVGYFSNYHIIYGAFATIPLFLVWLYISWLIILFGAMFVHTKGQGR